jgi:hypothetical protein
MPLTNVQEDNFRQRKVTDLSLEFTESQRWLFPE